MAAIERFVTEVGGCNREAVIDDYRVFGAAEVRILGHMIYVYSDADVKEPIRVLRVKDGKLIEVD